MLSRVHAVLHKAGTIKGVWFTVHRAANISALVLAVTAVAVIFSGFKWVGRTETAPYYTGEFLCRKCDRVGFSLYLQCDRGHV